MNTQSILAEHQCQALLMSLQAQLQLLIQQQ